MPSVARRNYRLGVINGSMFAFGEALNNADLVLSLLIRQLGGSLALVGLLPALRSGGYLLPQLLVGGRLQAQPYKLPLYRKAVVARLIAYLLFAAAIFGATALPPGINLWLIIGLYLVFTVGGGTSTLAFQDVVAKVIPPRHRGQFFAQRQFIGGLLGFAVAGPLASWLLGATSPFPFPANFGVLTLVSFVFIAIGLIAFTMVEEPPQERLGRRMSITEALGRFPSMLRANHNYRWFILARILLRIAQVAEPFYIIYATEVLGLSIDVVGPYLAIRVLAAALSNLLWGRVSARYGNRRLVLVTGALVALAPALALAGPLLVTMLGLGQVGLLVALGLVFLAAGMAFDGSMIAGMTYLLEIAPERERPTYIAPANTLLGLVSFVSVLGGWITTVIGYQGLFGMALLFGLLGLVACLQLSGGRAAPVRPAARG